MTSGLGMVANKRAFTPMHARKGVKRVLFQGDSITFAGRDKKNDNANAALALGRGYAFVAAVDILEAYPQHELEIYNKGIGGNKVFQLAERWKEDALDLQPDVISILIGVNDHWHTVDHHKYDGTVEVYQRDFMKLLVRTKEALPKVKFIIGEPFVLFGGTKIVEPDWNPVFRGYQKAARELAKDFDAEFIPYQSIFDKALKEAPVSYWAPDGVHPSLAGAKLMAKHWVKAFDKIAD